MIDTNGTHGGHFVGLDQTDAAVTIEADQVINSNSSKKEAAHVFGIDILRFVAASMVASAHLWGALSQGASDGFIGHLLISVLPGNGQIYPHQLPSVAFTGLIGVQIFFTISGFVIAYSSSRNDGFHSFLYKRFMRLVPGLWICTLVSATIALLSGFYPFPQVLIRIARSFVLFPIWPKVDDVVWTLNVEVVFYCYIAILMDIAGAGMSSPAGDINQSWGSGWGVRLLDRLVRDFYEG